MHARLIIIAAAAVALTAGCASSAKSSTPASRPAGGSSVAAGGSAVAATGGHLVGADGKTLYFNSVDTTKVIKCVGPCATVWPPLLGTPTPGAGLAKGSFSTTARPDGSTQVAYLGHPLYEFSGDTGPGMTNGNGRPDSGGTWTVAKVEQPSGASSAPLTGPPPASSDDKGGQLTGPPPASGGGYGYP